MSFRRVLKVLNFLGIYRRAKYIIFQMSQEKLLIIHLRMTGQFSFQSEMPDCKHTHVVLEFNDKRYLCFKDTVNLVVGVLLIAPISYFLN